MPPGWQPIADLCARVAEHLAGLTDRIAESIRDEIPAYAGGGVPSRDLWMSVFRNLEMMLRGIAERRGPTHDELEVRRELGRRRAAQGLPVDALIQAYHVGYRELWQALVTEARRERGETPDLLLSAATTTWQWIHAVTDAVASAHRELVQTEAAARAAIRQRFGEMLLSGDVTSTDLAETARSIGLEPDGEFRAYAIGLHAPSPVAAQSLQEHLSRKLKGICQTFLVGHGLVALCQRMDDDLVLDSARALHPGRPVGVGLERAGLIGARTSVGDALTCVRVAAAGSGLSRFEIDWFSATLQQAPHRFATLLRPGIEAAGAHPHLSETIRLFADSGFSLTETARRLSVHLNTVVYRLGRWHQLTGWDPRTFTGLIRSIASLDGVADGDEPGYERGV